MNAHTPSAMQTSRTNVPLSSLAQLSSADRQQPSAIGQTDEQHYQSRRKELVTRLAIMTLVTVGLAGAGALFLASPDPMDEIFCQENAAIMFFIPIAIVIMLGAVLFNCGGVCVLAGAVASGLASIGLLVLLLLDILASAYGKNLPCLCNFLPKIWNWILPKST